jgi:DNA modification methylase
MTEKMDLREIQGPGASREGQKYFRASVIVPPLWKQNFGRLLRKQPKRTFPTRGTMPKRKISATESKGQGHQGIAVVYRPIAQLHLDPKNPRFHSPRQIKQIARSVETFGFNVPVLLDHNNKVVAGHGRVLACKQLGRSEVPTIRLDHLSEAQANAFMIADNRLTENSTWDDRLLGEQLKDLALLDLDFDLETIGFEMGEIDMRIEGLSSEAVSDLDPADILAASGSGLQVSQAGDLWLLGRHRVYCGSALDEAAYLVLMQNKKAAMVITDPPYNVPIEGNVSGLGSIHHREFIMASGEMTKTEFTTFLTTACVLFSANTIEGSLHLLFMDWRHLEEMLAAGNSTYTELKNLCVWVKSNAGMGSLYRSQHELIFIFKHGRGRHRNNVQLGKHGRNRANVWSYAGPRSIAGGGDEGNLLALHPTIKPVALIADAILDCSARGDIVLDGFLGSGSTVIAAERTGRHCFGIELDPLYVDVTVRRWQTFTHATARHAASGQTFSEREERVGAGHAE